MRSRYVAHSAVRSSRPQIFDQQLSIVVSTGHVLFVSKAFKGTLECLVELKDRWIVCLKRMAGKIPVECVRPTGGGGV